MLLKAGVDISRLNREIRRALNTIEKVLERYDEELIVTSTYEGTHMAGSLHYANNAVDIRITNNPLKDQIVEALRNNLGEDFDVVAEATHIHIEYDPKK